MEAYRYEQKLIYFTLDSWVSIIARLKQSNPIFFPKLWTCLISWLLWWSFCGSVLLFKFNLISQSFSFSIFCKQKWILEAGLSGKKPSLFQELNPRSTGYGNAGSLPLDVAHTATHEEERVSKASLSLGCAFLKSIAHWHPGEVESPVRLPQSLWPYQKNGFLWHEVVLALIMLHHYCRQNLLLNFSYVWSSDLHLLTVVNCCFGGRNRAWPCLCLCVIALTNRYVAWCLCGGSYFFFFSPP